MRRDRSRLTSRGWNDAKGLFVARIDRQNGTRSAGANLLRGTMFGVVIGGGAGLILGAAAHDSYSCSDGGFCMSAGAGALGGAVVGAAVGSLIGLMYGPSERWQRGGRLSAESAQ